MLRGSRTSSPRSRVGRLSGGARRGSDLARVTHAAAEVVSDAMTVGRPLTANERAVIARLLSCDHEDVPLFRAQLPFTTASRGCFVRCGCGSLALHVDRKAARRVPGYKRNEWCLIAENGGPSWLMVHQKGGWLTELEHVPDYGDTPATADPEQVWPEECD